MITLNWFSETFKIRFEIESRDKSILFIQYNCQIFSIQTFISWYATETCYLSHLIRLPWMPYTYIVSNRQIYHYNVSNKKKRWVISCTKSFGWWWCLQPLFPVSSVMLLLSFSLVFFFFSQSGSEPGNGTAFIRIWRYCICDGW